MFSAEGTLADQGGMDKLSKADFHINYVMPAMRMFLRTRADGKPLAEIRVVADTWAWNEAKEGVGPTSAMATLAERAPLIKLHLARLVDYRRRRACQSEHSRRQDHI